MVSPLNWCFRLKIAILKVVPYIFYFIKVKPSIIGSYHPEISFYGQFNIEQSEKTGSKFGGNMKKGIFKDFFYCRNIY